jgi:hypothetical protein
MFKCSCYVTDDSCLAGRSFLFLDEKKRTKEKSKQNNAPARNPNAPPAVLLGRRACVREFNPIIYNDKKGASMKELY